MKNIIKKHLSILLCAVFALSCFSGVNFKTIAETVVKAAAVINIATELGDCNASGRVDVADLVRIKKHLAKNIALDETLSDICCDAFIDADDTAALKKLLLGFDISDVAYPRIEKTKYYTLSAVMADVNVKSFGAVGDGIADDTSAFVAAMSSLGQRGGVVFVPAGRYKLSGSVVIPSNVTLQGDFADPKLYGTDETKNGSRLEIYCNSIPQGNNTPFFRMQKYTALRGFMLWYPNQRIFMGAPAKYPYTVQITDWQSINLQDLYFVNSYNAIDDTAQPHNLETVHNIYMTPLLYGMESQYNNDVGRFENINIGPEWWLNSGLDKNIPDETALKTWMKGNTCGLRLYSIDNIFASDITVKGCNTAIYISGGYGKIYNFKAEDCNTGIDAVSGGIYGYTFTNGHIYADLLAVSSAAGSDCPLAFYNIDMSSNGANVVKNSSSVGVALTKCDISLGSDTGEYATYCDSGYITAVGCNIAVASDNAKCAYVTDGAVKTKFVNCNTADTFTYTASSEDKIDIGFDTALSKLPDSEFTDYAKQKREPARNVVYNVLDYGIDTTETKDVSDTLQYVINVASSFGGGIVYIPSNDYLLQKPITVKSGVELRGSFNAPHFGTATTTTFVTDHGKNDENGTALITFESNSGMKGITVDYSETRPDGTPYAYTLRGAGENIYIINCTVDSAWQVLDLMTHKCDNHYVEAVNFGTLKTGIAVGGGCENGTVRDCQSNPTSNRDSRNTVRSEWFNEDGSCRSVAWCLENVTGYIVDNAVNETHFMNFIYGCAIGLKITGNSTVTAVGHGTDQAYDGIYIDDSADVKILATELPVRMGTESYGIRLADGYTGKTDVVSAEIWAVGESGYYCGGGELNTYGSIMSQGGATAMQVAAGKAVMTSSLITRLGTTNFKVQNDADSLSVYGNILLTNKIAVHSGASVLRGTDVPELDVYRVSVPNEDYVVLWNENYVHGTNYGFLNSTCKYGSDEYGGYLYCTLDNDTNPIISFLNYDPVDASNMKYVEFDFYIPDDTLFVNCAGNMQLEISSSSQNDVNEIIYGIDNFYNGTLKSGWNHIKLDMDDFDVSMGSLDKSSVCRLRMYYVMNTPASGEIRIKNVAFTSDNYSADRLYFTNSYLSSGWSGGTSFVSCRSENDSRFSTASPVIYVTSPVDISEKDYMLIDVYISDANIFNDNCNSASIEITSSGTWDKAEKSFAVRMLKDSLATGWNTVRIPLATLGDGSLGEPYYNPEAVNFFRMYTNTDAFSFAVGNIVFE